MSTAGAFAITFPWGREPGSEAQNVKVDICAARLSQRCSCLPSTSSPHSYRDNRVFIHTLLFLWFLTSVNSGDIFVDAHAHPHQYRFFTGYFKIHSHTASLLPSFSFSTHPSQTVFLSVPQLLSHDRSTALFVLFPPSSEQLLFRGILSFFSIKLHASFFYLVIGFCTESCMSLIGIARFVVFDKLTLVARYCLFT